LVNLEIAGLATNFNVQACYSMSSRRAGKQGKLWHITMIRWAGELISNKDLAEV